MSELRRMCEKAVYFPVCRGCVLGPGSSHQSRWVPCPPGVYLHWSLPRFYSMRVQLQAFGYDRLRCCRCFWRCFAETINLMHCEGTLLLLKMLCRGNQLCCCKVRFVIEINTAYCFGCCSCLIKKLTLQLQSFTLQQHLAASVLRL